MKEKHCPLNDELEHNRDTIATFGAQGAMNYPSGADIVEYLQDFVAGLEWAQYAMTASAASEHSWNQQKLLAGLDAAWMHYQKLGKSNHSITKTTKWLNDPDLPVVQ